MHFLDKEAHMPEHKIFCSNRASAYCSFTTVMFIP